MRQQTPAPPLYRNRDFVLLWSGASVSNLGSNCSAVAYPLLVLALTGSPADAGLTGFVALLPQLIFQLPAGAFADRWNRKQVMIWCDGLRAVAIGSLVVALLAWHLSVAQILIVGFVEGTITVCYKIAASAAVPNVVHLSQLTVAVSRNEARVRGATMAGQPLGGALFGVAEAAPFLFDALSYVASLATLLLIRADFQASGKNASARRPPALRQMREGLVWLWHQPFLRMTTLLIAGSNMMFQMLFLSVIVVVRHGGARPAAIGLVFGIAGAGGVLGSVIAPKVRQRLSMRAVVVGTNCVWAILVPVIAVLRDPYEIGVVYALMFFVGPIWNVVLAGYQLAVTPDAIRGRVLSAVSLVAYGAIPLGSLLGGLMLSRFGTGPTMWSLTALMLLLVITAIASPAVRSAPDARASKQGAEPEPVAAAR
ncbi:MAG TPA: MFS transporter [Streptosporangiaceae bacterium]|nr:MFS transporter [Streptosporangiaceae bacterium]